MTDREACVVLGLPEEELFTVPTHGEAVVPSNMEGMAPELRGRVVVSDVVSRATAAAGGGRDGPVRAVPDGNRGAILFEPRVSLWGRRFLLALKGVGARVPMFSDGPMKFTGTAPAGQPVFSSELWFGESPWGAMSRATCVENAQLTEMTGPDGIEGFHICPMVRAEPLPEWIMEGARWRYKYRRADGGSPFYQQLRLLPSDVRLYFQSEATLGLMTSKVLEAFGVASLEDLDLFLDNYIRSGIAALTLMARTVKPHPRFEFVALDYDDVWLDKDSVIASDGTLFFADIEGLDWIPVRDETDWKVKRQFNRNFYEFIYGVDRLLHEREARTGRDMGEARRVEVAARLELALATDRYVRTEMSSDGLDLIVRPRAGPLKELAIRAIDLGREVGT